MSLRARRAQRRRTFGLSNARMSRHPRAARLLPLAGAGIPSSGALSWRDEGALLLGGPPKDRDTKVGGSFALSVLG